MFCLDFRIASIYKIYTVYLNNFSDFIWSFEKVSKIPNSFLV